MDANLIVDALVIGNDAVDLIDAVDDPRPTSTRSRAPPARPAFAVDQLLEPLASVACVPLSAPVAPVFASRLSTVSSTPTVSAPIRSAATATIGITLTTTAT